MIGNLLQLKEKKPHKTFTKWAEEYGPVYSIRTGSNIMVVLNSNDVAKEVNIYPSSCFFLKFICFKFEHALYCLRLWSQNTLLSQLESCPML